MTNDPAIRVGSIVTVKSCFDGRRRHVGKVLKMNVWDGIGGVEVMLPGNRTIEFSLSRCYNATEAQRREYFKAVLKHDD